MEKGRSTEIHDVQRSTADSLELLSGEPVYCSTEHKVSGVVVALPAFVALPVEYTSHLWQAHDVEEYKRLEAAGAQVIQKRCYGPWTLEGCS